MVDGMKSQWVIGKNSINEVIKASPERILEILTSGDVAGYQGFKVRKVSKHLLSQMVNSDSHQGLVARVQAKENLPLSEAYFKNSLVMIDGIEDPHNMGAILRAVEVFGVEGLIYSKNRGCGITPTVTKSSVGASELVDIFQVSNLATTLQKLQKEGFEVIVADMDGEDGFEWPEKWVLVMGAEGRGVQPLIKKKADRIASIPMMGRIDSLNVSQAAAVLLYAATRH
ncbi:MAG: 23S rRNA (guanosine-2'-O-)-methyltransferase RlmB [Chlamydiia bacterium]|nr:23S rRNA (guanosine-2'-O-)-methyltransferase RlmB [Chlamydiia bacterium]MCH9615747.1 23S rRNA (guanosine-2'-O-)-methyltransferase RlmB [Chlamydiia bacterium]MCH9628850.1 23S rRNA (guanosine-2'-O-)-methyltransferase RlmB [Chlamydiia bacterium]